MVPLSSGLCHVVGVIPQGRNCSLFKLQLRPYGITLTMCVLECHQRVWRRQYDDFHGHSETARPSISHDLGTVRFQSIIST